MATTHYKCEICGCIDTVATFGVGGVMPRCPNCLEQEDIFPTRQFHCNQCDRTAEQFSFFSPGIPADLDPAIDILKSECSYCGSTSYTQVPIHKTVAGNPARHVNR